MTLEIGFLFAVLAAMVYLFLTEKLPVDLTAFLGLVVLVFTGYVEPGEAFTGFSSPAVITMLAIFIVSAALLHTGLADAVGGRIHAWLGSREVPLIVALMLAAGVLSAFMNNIAATAVLMPAVASLAARARLPPSRLFMPLAFGAILGGTTTLVGTPPNIIAADMLAERGLEPFGLFEFTPVGLVLLGLGTVFMATLGRRLLPSRQVSAESGDGTGELAQLYQVRDKLFSIRIAPGSPLAGKSLGDSRLGTALHLKVVAVQRGGRRRLVPRAETVLETGDVLLVHGRREDVAELERVRGLAVRSATIEELPAPGRGIGGVRARLAEGSPLAGRTLRQLAFRERYGLVVLALRRDGTLLRRELGEEPLAEGDRILALGPRAAIERLAVDPAFEVKGAGFAALSELRGELYQIRVPPGSPLAGESLAESRLGELVGAAVAGIVRDGDILLAVSPRERLRAGDLLLVAGEPQRLEALLDLGEVAIEDADDSELEADDAGLVEAAVAPRSTLVGKTLRQLDFRERYGMIALSIWRAGRPIHGDLADLPLALGDALLLQGSRRRILQLARDHDFVVLSRAERPRRTRKAPLALGGLLLMVTLVVLGLQPIHVAAFTAASLVVLAGAVTMEEAYRAIEWRAIFLVAAVLPVGAAMERSGAASLLATSVSELVGPYGNHAILAALLVLSSLLSQGLDGAPAVVLLTPVVLDTATQLGISPYPLMMGVSLAASAAFMTPFSHKANLLVMGAGGYRSADYLRVGSPLTVVLLAVMTWLIPWLIPFTP